VLEKIVVGIVVAAAFVYAAWALTPAATRLALARKLVAATDARQSNGTFARFALRLEKAAGGGAHCAGCDVHSPKSPPPPSPE
jgi:hypothetical protein